MLAARGEYLLVTHSGTRFKVYPFSPTIAQKRAIPVAPEGWVVTGGVMSTYPQDEHTSWFYYRYKIADSSRMPIQALLVRKEMAGHPSWGSKWYGTPEDKAYLALSRDEQKAQLLAFYVSAVAARKGKGKKRDRVGAGATRVSAIPSPSRMSIRARGIRPRYRRWKWSRSAWSQMASPFQGASFRRSVRPGAPGLPAWTGLVPCRSSFKRV